MLDEDQEAPKNSLNYRHILLILDTLIDKYAFSSHQGAEMVGPEETSVEVCGFISNSFSCPCCIILSSGGAYASCVNVAES